METKSIGILAAVQIGVLVLGWGISSVAVRHGMTWDVNVTTFGKIYRIYGLILMLLPVIWAYVTVKLVLNDGDSSRIQGMFVLGALMVVLFVWISFVAFLSGTGGGSIIGTVN